jgi:hypothetical protein
MASFVQKMKECLLLRKKPPQSSFYGSYLYYRIVPAGHLLRKINQVVDFSFIYDLDSATGPPRPPP